MTNNTPKLSDQQTLNHARTTLETYPLGADAERMARALHPELAKRMIYTDSRNGRSRLSQMGAMTLVENTRAGGGKDAPVEDLHSEVTIFEVFENAAVVKVDGSQR